MALTLEEKKVLAYDYARYMVAIHPEWFSNAAITIVNPDFIDPSYVNDKYINEELAREYLANRNEGDQFDSIGKDSKYVKENSKVTLLDVITDKNNTNNNLLEQNNNINNNISDNVVQSEVKNIVTKSLKGHTVHYLKKTYNVQNPSWIDLDQYSNNNHFINGQCFVAVTFGDEEYSSLSSKYYNLPVYPPDVTNTITTSYATGEMLGRSNAVYQYNTTQNKTSSFTLHMHREMKVISEPNSNVSKLTDVNKIDAIVALIESAQYPNYTSTGLFAPIVTYKFGDTLISGIQTSVNTTWTGTIIEGSYMEVKLDINVTNLPDAVLGNEDIRVMNPRGYGYLSNSLKESITSDIGILNT